MARKKNSERQELQIRSNRDMEVYKRSDMIQRGRHNLTLQEQRCVLYAISKIKPDDSVFQEYTFELATFCRMCGLQGDSYTKLKKILLALKSKSWWAETSPGVESTVSWFSKARTNKREGTVTIRFDDDMMPYLLDITKDGDYFTHYQLKYVLPMKSQYAIRLYELLKSYQRNNYEWFFEIDQLKQRLNCSKYKDFCDFRRWVIEPAVEEINTYTDIKIAWEPQKEGRRVARVVFYMLKKKNSELITAERAVADALDGQVDFDTLVQQMNEETSIKREFFKDAFVKEDEDD